MKLTKKQAKEINALKRMREEDIDLADIPEVVDPPKGVVGRFYRPIKKSLTIRIDADVLAWIRQQGPGYQTRINGYLREVMCKGRKYPSQVIPEAQQSGYSKPGSRRRTS